MKYSALPPTLKKGRQSHLLSTAKNVALEVMQMKKKKKKQVKGTQIIKKGGDLLSSPHVRFFTQTILRFHKVTSKSRSREYIYQNVPT